MAEILDNFEFNKRGRGPSYPYHEWFNGQIWKLEEYTDFTCKPTSMRSALYMAAAKRGFDLNTSIGKDSYGINYVIVQAQPKQENEIINQMEGA